MIEENCYLVYNEEALLIIDPGEDAEQIKQEIKNKPTIGSDFTYPYPL